MKLTVSQINVSEVITDAIKHHGSTREALIPILNDVNRAFGYIPPEAFNELRRQIYSPADQVFVSESQFFGLASFYHMLSTKPLGRHVIRFCESAPCHVTGGRTLFVAVKDTLGIEPGGTSPDNKWSLITTSCLGVCSVGPILLIDDDLYGNVTPEQLPEILSKYD